MRFRLFSGKRRTLEYFVNLVYILPRSGTTLFASSEKEESIRLTWGGSANTLGWLGGLWGN
jgi:hypothetical protein